MLAIRRRQKSYADPKRWNVEFQEGEEILLRVSPTTGVIRFNTKGMLSPWYIAPFLIVARVEKLAYRLDLPESMKDVHSVFHVSMLHKYFRDPERQLTVEPITIEQDLTFEVRPMRILEESEKSVEE
jgi:hypothetical protein